MRSRLLASVLVMVLVGGCSSVTTPKSEPNIGTTNPIVDWNSYTYSYRLSGSRVNLVAEYSVAASLLASGELILDFGAIPGGDLIVQSSGGYYRLDNTGTSTAISLVGTELHLHQFLRVGNDLYYGVDDKLYRSTIGDYTFGDDAIVVSGAHGSSGTLFSNSDIKTQLQYCVGTDSSVEYLLEDGGFESFWKANTTPESSDDTTATNGFRLYGAYYGNRSDGSLYNVYTGQTITFDGTTFSGNDVIFGDFGVTATNLVGFGLEQAMNGVIVHGRMDASNSWYFGNIGYPRKAFNRDTMFRSYRDDRLYYENSLNRTYLVITASSDASSCRVEIYSTIGGSGVTKVADGFEVAFDVIGRYSKLVPNMWALSDGSLYLARANKVVLRSPAGTETEALVLAQGVRIDMFTVLPNGHLIAMDGTGKWFSEDGSAYNGQNIVGEF